MLLKVITFNMHHGKGIDGLIDVERQANFLKQYNPDIVFLQEIDMYTKRTYYANQIRLFSKEMRLNYSSMENNITLQEGFYGDGIISRFPISFSVNYLMPRININNEQRGVLRNKIILGNTSINLFSAHLSTNQDERILSCKEISKIIEKLSSNNTINILGGDFNIGKIRLGKGNYIYEQKDCFEEYEILEKVLKRVNNTEPTWHSDTQSACIDTIFYSNNIELVDFKTLDTDYSDHAAVLAEFNI